MFSKNTLALGLVLVLKASIAQATCPNLSGNYQVDPEKCTAIDGVYRFPIISGTMTLPTEGHIIIKQNNCDEVKITRTDIDSSSLLSLTSFSQDNKNSGSQNFAVSFAENKILIQDTWKNYTVCQGGLEHLYNPKCAQFDRTEAWLLQPTANSLNILHTEAIQKIGFWGGRKQVKNEVHTCQLVRIQ